MKYPSLREELLKLAEELRGPPKTGTPLGNNCFKIRLAISSKGRGKSGGARVITHTVVIDKVVFLLAIYDKSEQGALPMAYTNSNYRIGRSCFAYRQGRKGLFGKDPFALLASFAV